MEANSSFKELIYSLSEMLGESRVALTSKFGKSPDISEDKHRAFICYPNIYTVFKVVDNQVNGIDIPTQDAYGNHYFGPKGFFELDGVKLGMSRADVLSKWGEPDDIKNMNYENRIPNSGKKFTIGLEFEGNEDTLLSFSLKPYTHVSFEKRFIELCELLGCNEQTITDEIGKPDSTMTNVFGTKFLFYQRFKALFTISSDLQSASYVSSPISNIDGSSLNTKDVFYCLKGIKSGDNKSTIIDKWGKPSGRAVYVWSYNKFHGYTKTKNQYIIRISFDVENPEILDGFQGSLKEDDHSESVSGKPKSGCFIATACYGDYNSTEVLILRNYRDKVLLKSKLGSYVVSVYYLASPTIARFLNKSERMKTFVRKNILAPIIFKIKSK